MLLCGRASARGAMDSSSDRFLMVDPLSYFLFRPLLYDWCTKARGLCIWDRVSERVALVSSGSGFPLSLSELSFTMFDAI